MAAIFPIQISCFFDGTAIAFWFYRLGRRHVWEGWSHVCEWTYAGLILRGAGCADFVGFAARSAAVGVLGQQGSAKVCCLGGRNTQWHTCRIPSGRSQSCQTGVVNVALAKIRHAADGTRCTALAAFVADLAGADRRERKTAMSILTHSAFSVMLLLALLAGFWGHQRTAQRGF
jgi:hypothetical protein